MNVIEKNATFYVSFPLTALKILGFWPPDGLSRKMRLGYWCYTFLSFMVLSGTYIIIQVVDLFMIWGDLPLMTDTAFLLFTNFAQATKLATLVLRRRTVGGIVADSDRVLRGATGRAKEIVQSCNRETKRQHTFYYTMATLTVVGWALSAEKNQLPLRAWYPYDTSKSPAYELTYVHQVYALFVAAFLNVGKDALITTLIAQCHCRLRLVGFGLKTLLDDLVPNEKFLAQFSVSMIIICVTAFQLAGLSDNLVRLFSMSTYLFAMNIQVFLYCYHGDRLSEESSEIAGAAYECPWYACSVKLRRGLLVVMVRTRREAMLTAGGFTILSLTTFMSIVKTSYSLFTVLQQASE